jgi:hypothetical protein
MEYKILELMIFLLNRLDVCILVQKEERHKIKKWREKEKMKHRKKGGNKEGKGKREKKDRKEQMKSDKGMTRKEKRKGREISLH